MTEQQVIKLIYGLIHPDTTPDGHETSDGEILDMIFELVKPFIERS